MPIFYLKHIHFFFLFLIILSCEKPFCPAPIAKNAPPTTPPLTVNKQITNWQAKIAVSDSLLDLDFTDSLTGYVSGIHGTLLKTTDGGKNFTYLIPKMNRSLYAISFINSTTGIAVGDSGTILRTTNGGATWNWIYSGTYRNLRRVYFYDQKNVGFITGGVGTLLKTTDGGITWTNISPTTTDGLYGIFFTSANNGYVSGLNGTILRTTDGGNTWTSQNSGISLGPTILGSIYFTDKNHGIIVGGIGNPAYKPDPVILRTEDGGENWMRVKCPTNGDVLSQVKFVDDKTGYIVGGSVINNTGLLLKTIDGGKSWEKIALSSYRLTGLRIVNSGLAYGVGLQGQTIKGN